MSAEKVSETGLASVDLTPSPSIITKIKEALLNKRLARRAGQILDRIDRSRESQRATKETMRLFVHTPRVN